jgi:hypothetical protein
LYNVSLTPLPRLIFKSLSGNRVLRRKEEGGRKEEEGGRRKKEGGRRVEEGGRRKE